MDGSKREQLEAVGIDVDEALDRFMHNEALMLKFLLRFSGDENFAKLKLAMECGDAVGAFETAHTLKGVTGNLSMKDFYQQLCALVEDLRGGRLDSAGEKMPALEARYTQIVQALSLLA